MICSNCKKIIAESSTKCPFCGTNCLQKSVKSESKHKNIKKFVLIALLVSIFLLGVLICAKKVIHDYNNTVSLSIYNQLQEEIKKTGDFEKTINLSDFTNFEWDEVIIYGLSTVDDVEKEFAIKPEIKNKDAWIQGVIFYYQNKVVHNECYTFDFDDIPKDKIAIYPATFSDNNIRVRLKKEQSFFSVYYYEDNEEGFFRLFPTESKQ